MVRGIPKSALIVPALIAVLFAASVLVRLPNINRPLSEHHEWPTAHFLTTQQIWHEQGGWEHRFVPVMTFPGDGNRFICNDAKIGNVAGRWYYTSYPPLSWLVVYPVFRWLNVYPDVLPLQVISLALHLACAFLVYAVVTRLRGEAGFWRSQVPALVGVAVYLFAPVALWYHCNVYFSEMLFQPLFLGGVYALVRLRDGNSRPKTWLLVSGVLTFLMVYTTWLGVFFAAAACLCGILFFRQKERWWLLVCTVLASTVAVCLVFLHYSLVSGTEAFTQFFTNRFLLRTGYAEATDHGLHIYDSRAWWRLLSHYRTSYGFFLLYLFLLGILAFVLRRGDSPLRTKPQVWRLVGCITVLPVLIYHLVLFNNCAVHDSSVLISGVAVAVFTAGAFGSVVTRIMAGSPGREALTKVAVLLLAFVAAVTMSVREYWRVNANGHELYRAVGQKIREVAQPDEVVFLYAAPRQLPHIGFYDYVSKTVLPQVVFYAHRNIAPWFDERSAQSLLALNGSKGGIVFRFYQETGQIKMDVRRFARESRN